MPKEQLVKLVIFGTSIEILTDEPDSMEALAAELNKELHELANSYPNQKQSLILTLALLKFIEQNKKMSVELEKLTKDSDILSHKLQSFLTNI